MKQVNGFPLMKNVQFLQVFMMINEYKEDDNSNW